MRSDDYNVVMMGARDYYEVPLALCDDGRLRRLITDLYTPDGLRQWVGKRFKATLPSRRTLSIWPTALIVRLLRHRRFDRLRRRIGDDLYGFLSGFLTYLGPNRAIVYSYYLAGFTAFYRLVGRRPDHLICFQVHPAPSFINGIIDEDSRRFAAIAPARFGSDLDAVYTDEDMRRYRAALLSCDAIVCASRVTARSLAGGAEALPDCTIIPYGSKHQDEVPPPSPHWREGGKVKLLTVCQLTQRKGLHWAFLAMARMPEAMLDGFDWIVVANKIDPEVARFAPRNVRFVGGLSDRDLAGLFAGADLFVMPSLVEGFGLVYIEALSQGTPVVYTADTGADDICTDGIHGFRVAPSSSEAMADLFAAVAADPARLAAMRPACRTLARSVTWARFRDGIRGVLTPAARPVAGLEGRTT